MEASTVLTPPHEVTIDERPIVLDARTLSTAPDRGGYECSRCGHVLRVFGGGRHRIYFEPGNTRLDDPIMDGHCPECGLGLPGKQ